MEDEIPLEDINNFDDGDKDEDEENILVSEPEKVEEEKENFTKKRKIDYEKLEKNVLLTHHVRDVLAVSSLSDPPLNLCLVTKNAQIRLVPLKNLTPRRTSCLASGYSCLNLQKGDYLKFSRLCRDGDSIILGASSGRVLKFRVSSNMTRQKQGMKLLNSQLTSCTVVE